MGLRFDQWPVDAVQRFGRVAKAIRARRGAFMESDRLLLEDLIVIMHDHVDASVRQSFIEHVLRVADIAIAGDSLAFDGSLRRDLAQPDDGGATNDPATQGGHQRLSDRQKPLTLKGHATWVTALAMDPLGRWLASGGVDGVVRLWDVTSGRCLDTVSRHTSWVTALAVAPDRTEQPIFASGGADGRICLWRVEGNRLKVWGDPAVERSIRIPSRSVTSLEFGASCMQLSSGGARDSVRLSQLNGDVATQRSLTGSRGTVRALAYLSGLNRVAGGGDDRRIVVWDAETGACVLDIEGHGNAIQALAHDTDGGWLASGSRDGTVKTWDPLSGAMRREMRAKGSKGRQIHALAALGNGCLASGSEDGYVRLWDPRTGACLRTIRAHGKAVRALAAPNVGNLLASGGEDGVIKIWRDVVE